MWRHLGFPIRQSRPRSHVPDFVRGAQQSVGVGDGAAAHGTAMKDGGAAKDTHIEKPAQSELWPPEPAMDRPARAWEILRSPAPPHLHHGHTVALFHQPMSGYTAAKTGANYDEVEIEAISLPAGVGGTSGVGCAFSTPWACRRLRITVTFPEGRRAMRKLTEVEEAKALMTEATEWSVMKWLKEKKRVRKTADRANDALDQLSKETKLLWPDELRAAYGELAKNASRQNQRDAEPLKAVKQVKRADDEAFRARMDAESTFDEAESQLSTSMAREGCRKAIYSWELHENAIRMAERLIPSQQG